MLSLHPTVACLGTPLTASCTLDPSCLQIGHARPGDIVWRLNGDTRQLPLNQSIVGNGTVTVVTIFRAEQPHGELSCYLSHRSSMHRLGLAEYQAGVPPAELQVEHCISFWGGNITCYWDPGPETYLPTTYTLHITEEAGRCLWMFRDAGTCVSSRESRSCTIPVENLFASFRVRLTAVNLLGRASAADKCVHGMSIVKLSPPEVSTTADRSDCFHVAWWQPNEELLRVTDARYEIRYRDVDEASWTQVDVTAAENAPASKDVCGVSPFTSYSIQVRAQYQSDAFPWSDGGPSWSAWSHERFVRTLPAAPSRGPALWRRIATPDSDGRSEIILMWKLVDFSVCTVVNLALQLLDLGLTAMLNLSTLHCAALLTQPLQPKEANSRILTYSLRWQRKGQPAVLACLTHSLQCALELPASEEHTFFLTASNSMGESPASKLSIPAVQAQAVLLPLPVLVSPASDRSLLLQWDPPGFAAAAYVFEWGRASENRGQNSSWSYELGNISRVVLAEAIEPGYLYSLTIFALSDGAVHAAGSASAYSKQIAPFRAPALHPTHVWPSQVEVQWEEVPLEEQGGFIRNYTISYEEQGKDTQGEAPPGFVLHAGRAWTHQLGLSSGISCLTAVVVNGSVRRYLIAGLAPDSVVRVGISVSNDGGSTQGSVLSIRTRSLDDGKVELLLSSLCVGLVVLLITATLVCVLKHPLIQGCLWPQVPDPAKSHLASWLPQKMWLDLGNFPAEQSKKQRAGYPDFPFWGVSGIICGQQEEEERMCKSFLECTWAAEASSARDKYRQPLQTILLRGDVTTPDHSQARRQSTLEYSTVIVWAYPGDAPPSSTAPWPQPTPQSPDCSGPSPGTQSTQPNTLLTCWLGKPSEAESQALILQRPPDKPVSAQEAAALPPGGCRRLRRAVRSQPGPAPPEPRTLTPRQAAGRSLALLLLPGAM
ncbi:granulocyte colony-stimulating factor receptor-like [Gopherus evgoodei]|uniref:granulocyte colony-stimulating factor receptor-like n=1 Tax=Gopherus evgoodei TaxID=1825980 RepID=UPI0011CFFD6C|nr:granulocyte colony-stimulating factor receptor-like [Gopherus evgoodei]